MPKFHIGRQRRVDQGARAHCAAGVNDHCDALKLFSRRPVGVVNLEGKPAIDRLDKIRVGAIQSTWRAQIENFHRSHILGGGMNERDVDGRGERNPHFASPFAPAPLFPLGGQPTDARVVVVEKSVS